MKSPNNFALDLVASFVLLMAGTAAAASLKQAEFTRVINDVRMLPTQQQPVAAKLGDRISGQTAVSTGADSRAELRFEDNTLTRLGSNSVFRLDQADRTVHLEQGVLLLQVPKQIGGAKVRTAAVTAAVTGTTIMVEFLLRGFVKFIVLEGELDLFLNKNRSIFRTLTAGDMLIMKPDANSFPMPVKVDLDRLRLTSKLLDQDDFGPLGNQRQLQGAMTDQGRLLNKGELLKTVLQIPGRGTVVTLTNEARQEIFKNNVIQQLNRAQNNVPDPNNQPNVQPADNGGGPAIVDAGVPDNDTRRRRFRRKRNPNGPIVTNPVPVRPVPILNAGTTVLDNGSSIFTNPHVIAFNSVLGAGALMQGTIYNPALDGPFNTYMYGDAQTFAPFDDFLASHGNWFVFKGDSIFFAGNPAVDTSVGPRNLIFGAVGGVVISQDETDRAFPGLSTAPSWTIPSSVDAVAFTAQFGSITHDETFSINGSGGPQHLAYYAYGPGSDVLISGNYTFSTPAVDIPNGTFYAYAGRDIVLYDAIVKATEVKLTASRDVKIDSLSQVKAKTLAQIESMGSVQVTNSSQIAALLTGDPLNVFIKAINGGVNIDLSTIDAQMVEMQSVNGGITVGNSSILADVIKARTMSTGGELLINNSILGRDSPVLSSLIKLYGEGVDGVRFAGSTTLNASTVHIAGPKVTIDAGGQVKLANPAGTRVFTDSRNFNNGSNGNFTNLSGTPHSPPNESYGSRPAF